MRIPSKNALGVVTGSELWPAPRCTAHYLPDHWWAMVRWWFMLPRPPTAAGQLGTSRMLPNPQHLTRGTSWAMTSTERSNQPLCCNRTPGPTRSTSNRFLFTPLLVSGALYRALCRSCKNSLPCASNFTSRDPPATPALRTEWPSVLVRRARAARRGRSQ